MWDTHPNHILGAAFVTYEIARDGVYGVLSAGERERVTVALREAPEIEGGALVSMLEIAVAA